MQISLTWKTDSFAPLYLRKQKEEKIHPHQGIRQLCEGQEVFWPNPPVHVCLFCITGFSGNVSLFSLSWGQVCVYCHTRGGSLGKRGYRWFGIVMGKPSPLFHTQRLLYVVFSGRDQHSSGDGWLFQQLPEGSSLLCIFFTLLTASHLARSSSHTKSPEGPQVAINMIVGQKSPGSLQSG